MKKSIVLVGGGGHCKACIDVIELAGRFKIEGIVDSPEKLHRKVLGYEIIATDRDLPRLAKEFSSFLITVGLVRSPQKRNRIYSKLKSLQVNLPTITSPRAHVSKHACLGKGSIIMHDVIVNAGARVGNNCILNTRALVEHDAVIGDGTHISTSTVVNGNALIGANSFIGSNATVIDGVRLSDNYFFKAGSLIRCNDDGQVIGGY